MAGKHKHKTSNNNSNSSYHPLLSFHCSTAPGSHLLPYYSPHTRREVGGRAKEEGVVNKTADGEGRRQGRKKGARSSILTGRRLRRERRRSDAIHVL